MAVSGPDGSRDTAWAMSQENVEIVRRAFAYEIYGVGDRAEAEAIFDPNVVMNPTDERPSYGFDAMRSEIFRGVCERALGGFLSAPFAVGTLPLSASPLALA
jgi:hypothetical protein